MTSKTPKPNPEFVASTWRKLVMFEAARAGLDPNYVMDFKPQIRGGREQHYERDALKVRALGCRHLALYLAHTLFGISMRDLVPHAGVKRQRISEIIQQVEDCRDDEYYNGWITTVEKLLASEVPAHG